MTDLEWLEGRWIFVRLRTAEKRSAILEAATQVFLQRGYEATTMAEVAARVGGSKQTLYGYFESKEQLFVAVMLERGARQIGPLASRFRAVAETDLRAALADFGRSYLTFIGADDSLAFRRIIITQGAKSDLGKRFYDNGPKRGWGQMADFFAAAMDDGRLTAGDPWQAAMIFQGLLEAGPYQRCLEGVIASLSPETIEAATDVAVEVFFRAFGGGSPAPSS